MERKCKNLSTLLLTGALAFNFNCIPILPQCPEKADHSWIEEGELQEVYVLGLEYNRGIIRETGLDLTEVYFYEEKEQPSSGYNAMVFNENNQPIFERRFQFPLVSISEGFPHIGIEDKAEVEISIPYRDDIERIGIYKNCREILSIPLE